VKSGGVITMDAAELWQQLAGRPPLELAPGAPTSRLRALPVAFGTRTLPEVERYRTGV
jgi:hypothetical protein